MDGFRVTNLVVGSLLCRKFDFCALVILWMLLYQEDELSVSSREGLFSMHLGRSGGYAFRVDEICFEALLCQEYELSSTCRFMNVCMMI